MQAYMKSEMPYRGIPSPELKAVLRPLLANHPLDEETWQATVLALWDEAGFREERYAALALARHRLHREHRQAHTIGPLRAPGPHRRLVGPRRRDLHPPGARAGARPPGRGEAGHPGVGGGRRPVGTPQRDHLPGRRQGRPRPVTAGRGDRGEPRRVDADHAAVSPYGREFFIRKAIGWALRDHARVDPDWVQCLRRRHHDELAGLSRREALKHLRLSRRCCGSARPPGARARGCRSRAPGRGRGPGRRPGSPGPRCAWRR